MRHLITSVVLVRSGTLLFSSVKHYNASLVLVQRPVVFQYFIFIFVTTGMPAS